LIPPGFEPGTFPPMAGCSIQLSYGTEKMFLFDSARIRARNLPADGGMLYPVKLEPKKCSFLIPPGFEPGTFPPMAGCSIQLSYGTEKMFLFDSARIRARNLPADGGMLYPVKLRNRIH
jgi:hypothetical protein